MASFLEFKKGSSLYEAAFSLAKCLYIHVTSFGHHSIYIGRGGLFYGGVRFDDILSKAKECDSFKLVKGSGAGSMECCCAGLLDLLNQVTGKKEVATKVVIITEPIEKIRALAKELRTDKAVAKAAIKPIKPKADLKTRRDAI